MKAIPTEYGGVRFRSRLEAKWAAFFDLQGWRWEYEPLDLEGYVPDFALLLPAGTLMVEVKPLLWDSSDRDADILRGAKLKLRYSGWEGEALILGNSIPPGSFMDSALGLLIESGTGGCDAWDRAEVFECLDCGSRSFCHASGSFRCRVRGCYDGDGHQGGAWDAPGDFKAAANRVQWRAA